MTQTDLSWLKNEFMTFYDGNPLSANPFSKLLTQPDLVIYLHAPLSDVVERGGISPSLFVDTDFQQTLRICYADPRTYYMDTWKGISVLVYETQMNRWASKKALIRRIQGEFLLWSELKPWNYLWENREQCHCCYSDITHHQPVFRCFRRTNLVHYICLMENSGSQKIPLCQACGVPASSADPAPEQGEEVPTPVEGPDASLEEAREHRGGSQTWSCGILT